MPVQLKDARGGAKTWQKRGTRGTVRVGGPYKGKLRKLPRHYLGLKWQWQHFDMSSVRDRVEAARTKYKSLSTDRWLLIFLFFYCCYFASLPAPPSLEIFPWTRDALITGARTR